MKFKMIMAMVLSLTMAVLFCGCNTKKDSAVADKLEANSDKSVTYYKELPFFPSPVNFTLATFSFEDHNYSYTLSTDDEDSRMGLDAYVSCLKKTVLNANR